ncbi:MAG TPA: NAD(+) synthase [Gemmatimonadales bacterium]|jgi:NAD+ synthetase
MPRITVALCQFRPTKGSLSANLDTIEKVLRAAAGASPIPDVLVFPEASLTGYFLEGGVQEHALTADDVFAALRERHLRSGAPPIEVCLGCYELFEGRLHNAAIWVALGGRDAGIRHVHRKVFLPTYGVFDEERFVEAGREVRAFDTRFGRAAMLVCEDAWHSITGTLAALDGAQLIAVVSASPARGLTPDARHPGQPTSLVRWESIAEGIAGEHGVFVALAQLVGFEGGKGFPGGSTMAAPTGEIIARAPLFEDAMVPVAIDLDEITRVRAASPLLADLELKLPHLLSNFDHRAIARPRATQAECREGESNAEPDRHISTSAGAPPSLAIDPSLTRRWLVEFLRDEVTRGRGFTRVVVAISGGIDSAVVAYLAAEAFGAANVTGLRLPYRTSSPDSLDDARLVTAALGIEERTIDITSAVDGYAGASGIPIGPARLGNVMARVRMAALFDVGAALDALPLGTGNKTERLLGYFTWHADDAPPVNPIGDLFKTQVRALAAALGVPGTIIAKPASADLIAGQTDEGDFGLAYDRADPILELLLRGHDASGIADAGFTAGEIALVRRRLDGTHWKRRLPSVAMVSQTAIGEYYLRPLDYSRR